MKEKPRARSRKKKSFPLTEAIIATGVALTAVTGMGVGYYIYKGKEYETTFFQVQKLMESMHRIRLWMRWKN